MQHNRSWEANRFSATQDTPAFYGIQGFITAFTTARHLSLFWVRSILSMSRSHFLKIHFNIILPSMPESLWLRFPHQASYIRKLQYAEHITILEEVRKSRKTGSNSLNKYICANFFMFYENIPGIRRRPSSSSSCILNVHFNFFLKAIFNISVSCTLKYENPDFECAYTVRCSGFVAQSINQWRNSLLLLVCTERYTVTASSHGAITELCSAHYAASAQYEHNYKPEREYFNHVCKSTERDYKLRHVCLSASNNSVPTIRTVWQYDRFCTCSSLQLYDSMTGSVHAAACNCMTVTDANSGLSISTTCSPGQSKLEYSATMAL